VAHVLKLLQEPGEHAVDVPITCSITRFGLRNRRSLASSYLNYRRVLRASDKSQVDGLLRSAFLLEDMTTWYSFSIWSGTPKFSAYVPDHIEAAREIFGHVTYDPEHGPELWSTKWRLVSVTNNLHWNGFDLRRILADRMA
jgi:hypothetical protein